MASLTPRSCRKGLLYQNKIIDVVSKNGNMLLNIGLRADGSIAGG